MSSDDAQDPDSPPTEEEVAASKRLRDALESGGDPSSPEVELATALASAWSPSALDEQVHAEMLDDLPTAEELLLAEELRQELETVPLVAALRSAYEPRAISDEEHRAIVAKAIGTNVVPFRRPQRLVRIAVVATSSVVAIAASIVLYINNAPSKETPIALVPARSTQSLFEEPFRQGDTSARIDKIALARASDYRDNRFAKWGVR